MIKNNCTDDEIMTAAKFRDLIDPGYGYFIFRKVPQYKLESDRKLFLKGKITEQQLNNRVFSSYRRTERAVHNYQIGTTLKLAGCELIDAIVKAANHDIILENLKAIVELVKYINKSFEELNIVLDYKDWPAINGDYQEIRPNGKLIARSAYHSTVHVIAERRRIINLPERDSENREDTVFENGEDTVFQINAGLLTLFNTIFELNDNGDLISLNPPQI